MNNIVKFEGNGTAMDANETFIENDKENKAALARAVVKIKVFGVGGGGGNVLKRLVENDFNDVELVAVNTDTRALNFFVNTPIKSIQIGGNLTRGHGTGGKFEIGEEAAKRDAETLKKMMLGADMIFITATMGGGAGTGAAPVIAAIAKSLGILTVGVITVPFTFEGNRKMRIANEGIAKMQASMDALVIVKNDNLLKLMDSRNLSVVDSFKAADTVLRQAIRCIAELILKSGFINVDFADVTTIFQQSDSSDAILGIGQSNINAVKAVQQAMESPLIDRSLKGARGIILNVTGDENLSLHEVNEAAQYIYSQTDGEVNIIFGVVIDEDMNGIIQAMIIATDFKDSVALKTPDNSMTRLRSRTSHDFNIPVPQFPNKTPKSPNVIPLFQNGRDKNE